MRSRELLFEEKCLRRTVQHLCFEMPWVLSRAMVLELLVLI